MRYVVPKIKVKHYYTQTAHIHMAGVLGRREEEFICNIWSSALKFMVQFFVFKKITKQIKKKQKKNIIKKK